MVFKGFLPMLLFGILSGAFLGWASNEGILVGIVIATPTAVAMYILYKGITAIMARIWKM